MIEDLRKAAVLISSMDRQMADALLSRLDPDAAHELRRQILELSSVDAEEQDDVIQQFLGAHRAARDPEAVALELESAISDDTSVAVEADESTDNHAAPFHFLRHVGVDDLSELLKSESPQVAALVMSHLDPKQAAENLFRLPEDMQAEVMRRMAQLDEIHPEAVREVERIFEARTHDRQRVQHRKMAGIQTLSRILAAAQDHTSQSSEAAPNLGSDDGFQEADEKLSVDFEHQPAWSFEDLQRLEGRQLVAILSACDPELAMLALAGASPALYERLVTGLSNSERRLLRLRLEQVGPIRLRDVERAQQHVVQTALRLAEQGKIQLNALEGVLLAA